MYGKAIYFAADSNYSDSYKHIRKEDGMKQMLYARVMIGNTVEMKQDKNSKNLLTPPAIDPKNPNKRYDSVKGRGENSDIYMIYENGKAYPEYVISYK